MIDFLRQEAAQMETMLGEIEGEAKHAAEVLNEQARRQLVLNHFKLRIKQEENPSPASDSTP